MADINFNSEGQTSSTCDIPSELIVYMEPRIGISEFHGTRAMLEAEGVLPPNFKWPDGYHDERWESNKCRYWLRRHRPEGAKGPRKQFINVDWWHLRFDPVTNEDFQDRMLKRKAKELQEYAYRISARGRAESNEQWRRFYASRDDNKFQAFKALIPGLIQPEKPRRTKSVKQTKGATA